MEAGELLLRLLHAALLLAAAPLVDGLLRWARSRLDGRRGASPVQPYRDLLRALRRRPVLAFTASPVSAAAPLLAVAALALAAGLLPPVAFSGASAASLGPAPPPLPVDLLPVAPAPVSGDLVLVAALLGLSRAAQALALLDAGTAAGGLGAARLLARPALFEPALLLVALCAAALAGADAAAAAEAGGAGAPLGTRAPLLFALGAVLLVAASDTQRPPVAASATAAPPHDLGDAPEASGSEFSGWHAALWTYARALRSALFLALLAALLPGPPGVEGAAGAALRPLLGLLEFAAIGAALAAAESGTAALRSDRLPAAGAGALALAAAAAALLLLGGPSA